MRRIGEKQNLIMKKVIMLLLLAAVAGGCKEEPAKEICYNCVQTITTFQGLKETETKNTKEMCGFTAKNFYEQNLTFTNKFPAYTEISIAKCTQKP